ncbi:cytosolic sulfotransferase 15-like [Syzygium oleosum]|uniref:cytosolic sulfotransferase 15-like n=1 Tax=Syzygium oleosum TaxID=219896 RepID=UPI0024B93545|nr:cytosolic sulfotransferase 15-like [Syzygium oleosum]
MGMGEGEQQAIDELIASLPQEKVPSLPPCCLFQNFWCPMYLLPNVVAFQRHFKAKDKDLIVASDQKSGTTWLMAIAFSIVKRSRFDVSNTPLLTSSPHELIPRFELDLFVNNPRFDLDDMEEPRLLSTHLPYSSLPECVMRSDCRIIYICRNPLDIVVSSWHFFLQLAQSEEWSEGSLSLEEHFEIYCQGKIPFGPFWDHMVGYWKESLERPHKVLFLKYEDLKEDIVGHLKNVAEFVGLPFTEEEEEGGVIEEIAKMCSFKTLKDLEVNKSGKLPGKTIEKRSFFRKGEVGDWVNHLTPSMVDRLNSIMQENLSPFGLEFKRC